MVSIWKEPEAAPAPSIVPYFTSIGPPPPLYPEIVRTPEPPESTSEPPSRSPIPTGRGVWHVENTWMREQIRTHRLWMCVSSPYLPLSSDLLTGAFLFNLAFLFTFFPFLFYAADMACPRSVFFIETVFTSFFSLGAGGASAWAYLRSVRHKSALQATRDIEAPPEHYQAQERAFQGVQALRSLTLFLWGLSQAMAIASLVTWYHTDRTGLGPECTRHVEAHFMVSGTFLAVVSPLLAAIMRVVSVHRITK